MKIKFLKDYQVKAEGGPFYRKGQVVNLPDPSAQHFLNKKRAELFKGDEPAETPEVKPAEAEAPKAETPETEAPEAEAGEKPEAKKANKAAAKPLGTAKRGRPSKQASGSEFEQHRQDHPDGE